MTRATTQSPSMYEKTGNRPGRPPNAKGGRPVRSKSGLTVKQLKAQMGYELYPKRRKCSNCKYFTMDKIVKEMYVDYKNMFCHLGEFAVKRLSCCLEHEWKEDSDDE